MWKALLSSQVSAVLMISLWLVYIGMSGTDGSPMDHRWDFHREFIGKNITFENMGNVKCIWNYYKSDFDHGNITLSYYQKFVSDIFQILLMGTSHDISDWIKHWCRVMFFEKIPARFLWFPPITLRSVFVLLGFHVATISIGKFGLGLGIGISWGQDMTKFPEIPS